MASGSSNPAVELIAELRALESSGAALATFDERRIRDVANRINQVDADMANLLSNPHADLTDPYYSTVPQILHQAMLRDKRCIVTYLRWRLNSLSRLWWDSRDQLAAQQATPAEAEYIKQYNAVMVAYMGTFETDFLDFRSHTTRPPCLPPTNIVEVRGLKAVQFTTETRTVVLYPGKVCSVSVEDAEVLVRQEMAEYILV